mmetsp:Transcript_14658/g.21362  ORF Transcript_14658/g.21362 Transcript_14658/m.21362 type:complete len:341 (-) Transcript_14658:370-1392(-)
MIVALLLQSVFAVQGLTCPKYKCSSITTGGPRICVSFQTTEPGTYLLDSSKCLENEYCPPNHIEAVSVCEEKVDQSPPKWPGEKCSSSLQCKHSKGGCVEGKCQGSAEKESCLTSDNCNPGLFCSNGVCVPQISIGRQGCDFDHECVNNAACITKKCLPYFSIKVNDLTPQCDDTHRSLLCEEEFCYRNSTSGLSYCGVPPKSKKLPTKCNSNSDCISEVEDGVSINSTCECGYNRDGQAYCSQQIGDPYNVDIYGILKKWYNSEAENCNTYRRGNWTCMKDYMSDWATYNYKKLYSENYPRIYDAEDCVLEVYQNDFYQAEKDYDFSMLLAPFITYILF